MWLVRDFALKLQSNGRDITPKEYLENSLALLPVSCQSPSPLFFFFFFLLI